MKVKADSYNQQDMKKHRLVYNDYMNCWNQPMITHNVIIEIIQRKGDVNCAYCKKETNILPSCKTDPMQFTLDRIDNTISHIPTNCVISCWKCNEKRGKAYYNSRK